MADTTGGMTADYAAHDEYQSSVAATANDVVREAAARVAATVPGNFTLVDYGCATNPHAAMVRAALEAVRSHDPAREIAVVHNDLPTNDWNALFASATDATRGYLSGCNPPPLALASARSFFEPVVPAACARLGISFSAAHWLRAQPQLDAGSWGFSDAAPAAFAVLAQAAAADWESFLQARAHDLISGGILIVQALGTAVSGSTRNVSACELLRFMRSVAQEFVADGSLERTVFERFVFPTYARTADEARAPLLPGTHLSTRFEIEKIDVFPVENPYLSVLKNDGAAAYAERYVAFVRSFTVSTLSTHLFAPGARGQPAATLLDAFYQRMRTKITADPALGLFADWTLQVIVRRR